MVSAVAGTDIRAPSGVGIWPKQAARTIAAFEPTGPNEKPYGPTNEPNEVKQVDFVRECEVHVDAHSLPYKTVPINGKPSTSALSSTRESSQHRPGTSPSTPGTCGLRSHKSNAHVTHSNILYGYLADAVSLHWRTVPREDVSLPVQRHPEPY